MDKYVPKVGSPPKIDNKNIRDRILAALSKGATYIMACNYAGVTYVTFRQWMITAEKIESGEKEIKTERDQICVDFRQEVLKVESMAALKWLEKIDNAMDIHWQAAAWKLERRHPDQYGRPEKRLVNDDADKALEDDEVDYSKLDAIEAAKVYAERMKK